MLQRLNTLDNPLSLEPYLLKDEVDGKNIAVYHGQDENITNSLLKSNLYDVIFTGHTHVPLIETVNKTLHINPGPICDAADSKIIKNPTLALYDTNEHDTKIIEFLKEVT